MLQPPIGGYKHGGAQLAVSIKESFEAPKRPTRKVTTGFVLIGGGCRMNVVNVETHGALFPSGQPIAAGEQRLRRRVRIERATIFGAHQHECVG